MNFDPNKQKQPNQVWATYIPGRSPAFKTYAKRSYAISSLHYRFKYVKGSNYTQKEISNDLKLYKFVDGLWKEVEFTRVFDSKGKIEVYEPNA